MSYPTLTEIKNAKVARMREALDVLTRDLAAYAREHGGRFILFGSAARGELRHSSDIDILVDFPSPTAADEAKDFAEERAIALGLSPDITSKTRSGPRLLDRIAFEGRVLG